MSEITTKMENVSPIKKKIEVSIPADMVKKALENGYNKVGKNAKLKGFRKGKIPRHMLEQYYSDEVKKEVIDTLVRETYPEAVQKEMVVPISAPYVEPGALENGKPFTYTATFEIRPVVEIKEYKGLNLERPEVEVTKEEVDYHLGLIQQQMTQLEPLPDGTKSEKGMAVVVDFKGTADGKVFKGSETKDFLVELGVGSMLPQFEDALTGLIKGEKKEFEIDYPADYFNKELAGKKGRFKLLVKEVKKKLIPELNDEFAKDLGKFEKIEDVKKDIEKRISEAKDQESNKIISSQVLEQLVERHPFEVPESMTTSELKAMFESFIRHLASQGKKLEDTKMTIEEFVERYKKDAENRVRGFLIIDAIAEIEKIGVSDEELDERLKLIATQMGQPHPKVRQEYEKQNLLGSLRLHMKHEKTMDRIIGEAKVKVKKVKTDKKTAK